MDLTLWQIGRVTGLASYAALCISIVSGVALRTSVLDFLAKNRALRALHDWTLWLWIPLGFAHVATLVLDQTARLELIDVFVPFQTDYGQLAISLGTLSLDLLLIIVLTSWFRRRMNNAWWTWIHRTSYVMFLALFLHAYLAGTDFDSPIISSISWSAAAGLALLSVSRIFFGRLAE